MFSSNCCFLTCIQISQEAGKVVWYSHHLKNFPQFVVIHTVRGFGTVNKGEVDVFLELSCFLNDPADAGNLTSGSSAFSKSSLSIWKVTVHVLLKPGLENFEHYFANVWGECNGAVVWTFFGIAFLWDWNENWHFPVPWPLLFSKFAGMLSAALSQHHLSVQFSSVTRVCPTLCDPMSCSTPGLPVHHQLHPNPCLLESSPSGSRNTQGMNGIGEEEDRHTQKVAWKKKLFYF